MSQRMKALKDRETGKIFYFFPNPAAEFTAINCDTVTVEVTEIKSPLCATCSFYDWCKSAIKGNDFDCSSYSTDTIIKTD